jgi:hypothetical protein
MIRAAFRLALSVNPYGLDIEPCLGSLPYGEARAPSSIFDTSFLRRIEAVEVLISSKKGKIKLSLWLMN